MLPPKILVVEDETIVAMDIARGLRGLGYEVVATAAAGHEAIRLADQHRPDLVLMDIRLQGPMDGVEAGREIRRRLRLPIVFLTAYADEGTVSRAKVAEPFGYVLKPFEDRELHTAVEIALHKRRLEEESLKAAGEAVRRSEERYRLLVDSLKDYAVYLLDPQGRIASWNSGAQRMKGYTEEEALGQHFALFYRPEEVVRNKPDQLLWTAAHQGRAADEGWRVRKDGSRFWADSVITALQDEAGELIGFSRVTRDITDKKRAEEEIRKLNASLERRVEERTAELTAANRELEAFTYSVAHDLRGPLRGIRSYLDMLRETGSQLPAQAMDYLQRGVNCAERMRRLIDDLLRLAQVSKQPMECQEVSLAPLVAEVIHDLRPETEGRRIEWRVEPLPTVQGDPGLLRQVFLNLLSNAVKYTRPCPSTTIEVGQDEINGEPVLFVRDNGVGFDMAYANKLFQPFSRLHRSEDFDGTGVGLALVERIVGRHGGRIWAEAHEGRGAAFYFTLSQPRSPIGAGPASDRGVLEEQLIPTRR